MKHISTLFSGLLLAAMAAMPMAAQTNYDVWVTTEGSGVAIHGGQPTRQVVVHHDVVCRHHPHHFHKGCKECKKAYKKHRKAVKKAHKHAEKHHHHQPAKRHHHR